MINKPESTSEMKQPKDYLYDTYRIEGKFGKLTLFKYLAKERLAK